MNTRVSLFIDQCCLVQLVLKQVHYSQVISVKLIIA